MTQLKRQVIAVLTTGSLALTMLAPAAFADTSLSIGGNGASSDNTVKVEQSTNTTVVQSNNAVVTNTVNTSSSTGGNNANDNTGGDVMIRTGNAASTATIQNTLNSNAAQVSCCNKGDVSVDISGNGADSENKAILDQKSGAQTSVFQDNTANVLNSVDTKAKTGGNEANNTTGGDVTIRTGDAVATNTVSTTANVNQAVVGSGDGTSQGTGSLTATIGANGAYSDNKVKLDLSKSSSIVQDNMANVVNDVNAKADSGYNKANDSTNGEVAILTGAATANTQVDNNVNFNAAEIDCGCILNASTDVSGNGYDSTNSLKAKLGNDVSVFQGGQEGTGNNANLVNNAGSDAKTGKNDAKFNTGSVMGGSDPFIWTGDATNDTTVSNSGNSNVFGTGLGMNLPTFDFNFNLANMFGNMGN